VRVRRAAYASLHVPFPCECAPMRSAGEYAYLLFILRERPGVGVAHRVPAHVTAGITARIRGASLVCVLIAPFGCAAAAHGRGGSVRLCRTAVVCMARVLFTGESLVLLPEGMPPARQARLPCCRLLVGGVAQEVNAQRRVCVAVGVSRGRVVRGGGGGGHKPSRPSPRVPPRVRLICA